MDFVERDFNDWVLEESDRHTFLDKTYFDSTVLKMMSPVRLQHPVALSKVSLMPLI